MILGHCCSKIGLQPSILCNVVPFRLLMLSLGLGVYGWDKLLLRECSPISWPPTFCLVAKGSDHDCEKAAWKAWVWM